MKLNVLSNLAYFFGTCFIWKLPLSVSTLYPHKFSEHTSIMISMSRIHNIWTCATFIYNTKKPFFLIAIYKVENLRWSYPKIVWSTSPRVSCIFFLIIPLNKNFNLVYYHRSCILSTTWYNYLITLLLYYKTFFIHSYSVITNIFQCAKISKTHLIIISPLLCMKICLIWGYILYIDFVHFYWLSHFYLVMGLMSFV